MPKESHTKRNQMRERIAYLAARLIAEDGIQDFGMAKRKAAQQLGAQDTQNLPNNTEVEQALRTFQALYHREEQAAVLRKLREVALSAMKLFERFNPYLTGSVLSGTATRYSDVNLQLYTDSVKDVELFLIDRAIAYRRGELRGGSGDSAKITPTFTIEMHGALVNMAVFSGNDLRIAPKNSMDSMTPTRAKAMQVEQLLKDSQG